MTTRIEDDAAAQGRAGRGPALRRKRSGVALIALLGILTTAVAGAFSAVALRAETARDDIEIRLAELTGLDVVIEGDSHFALLPRTQLSLTEVRIGSPGNAAGSALAIDAIVADLDLWPALWGQTRIERLSVIRPELLATADYITSSEDPVAPSGRERRLTADTNAGTREGFLQLSRYFGSFLSRFGDLRAIDIRDGVFRMSAGSGTSGISNANILVTWPSKSSPALLSGSYVWNGQPTDVALTLAAPLDFLGGRASGIDLDLSSPPLTVSFEGDGAIGGNGRFSGALSVATPSLTRSIRWLGDPRAVLPDIGALSIEATVDGVGRNLALRDATVSLDGFAGEGTVEMLMASSGKPALGGTLAFQQFDFTGFAEAVAPLPKNPFELQRPISVAFIDQLDLDLRLSAQLGGIGTLPLSDIAATLKFKDGVATVDIGDAGILGGRGQGRVSIDSRARSPVATGFVAVNGIDTAEMFSAIGVSTVGVSGRSDISAEISSPVSNWADVFRRNRMTLNVSARNGTLSGFDPDVFLGEGTRPFALATEPNAIPFRTLKAKILTKGPVVDLDEIVLDAPSGAFEASGVLSTATNQVDIVGSFLPRTSRLGALRGLGESSTSTPLASSQPIGFRMRGEWPRPSVTSGPPASPI